MVRVMAGDRVLVQRIVPTPLLGVAPSKKEEAHDAKGYQGVFVYPAGVILVRISGELRAGPETERVTQYLRTSITEASGRVLVFFDLESFSHYQSEVRTRYTDAVLGHGSKVERIWIYADSRMVRMGASVAGLALRQLQLVDRKFFDEELARVTAR